MNWSWRKGGVVRREHAMVPEERSLGRRRRRTRRGGGRRGRRRRKMGGRRGCIVSALLWLRLVLQ